MDGFKARVYSYKANANWCRCILGNRYPQPVAFLAFHQPCHFPKDNLLKYLRTFVLFDVPFPPCSELPSCNAADIHFCLV